MFLIYSHSSQSFDPFTIEGIVVNDSYTSDLYQTFEKLEHISLIYDMH